MVLLSRLFGRGTRRFLAALFGAGVCVGLGLYLLDPHIRFGGGVVRHSYGFQLVARGDTEVTNAVILYLDELSHTSLGQPLNAPWDRKLHARLIRRLAAAGARAIVFDVVFSDADPLDPTADVELADAIRESRRVLLGIDVVYLDMNTAKGFPPIEHFSTNAMGAGSVEAPADIDLVVRELLVWDDDLGLPGLSYAAAAFVQGKSVDEPPSDHRVKRWLNYYGSPHLLPWASYVEALEPGRLEDGFFRDKVVFIGARLRTRFAGERKDEFAHPFAYWLHSGVTHEKALMNFVPGVAIQATACLNLLRGDWLSRLPMPVERLIIATFGLAFGFGLIRLKPVMATVVGVGGLVILAAAFQLLFNYRLIWFPVLVVAIQIFVALAWSILFNAVQSYVQQRLLEHTLSLYLSPKLARKLARNPEMLKPGAKELTISIFFSDIADFTELSRQLSPEELVQMMNNYFQTAVTQCIKHTDGTVVKYIGDAIFAFWNAPELQADHAWRACCSALYFRERVIVEVKGRLLQTRIGLHTGLARVGNFGSTDRIDYTALGEHVNLAARLEGLNKVLKTECVISRETCDGLRGRLLTRLLGLFQLKGFDQPIEVHELIGWPAETTKSREWREAFAQALDDYREARLDAADAGFRRTLELRPGDGPSEFYLARLAEWRRQAGSQPWVPYTIMLEK